MSLLIPLTLGLFSTLHCVGMCGGIVGALTLGTPPRARWRLIVTCNLGRVLSYTVVSKQRAFLVEYPGRRDPRIGWPPDSGMVQSLDQSRSRGGWSMEAPTGRDTSVATTANIAPRLAFRHVVGMAALRPGLQRAGIGGRKRRRRPRRTVHVLLRCRHAPRGRGPGVSQCTRVAGAATTRIAPDRWSGTHSGRAGYALDESPAREPFSCDVASSACGGPSALERRSITDSSSSSMSIWCAGPSRSSNWPERTAHRNAQTMPATSSIDTGINR